MSVFSMFPDSAVKEIDFDTASDSTASGYDMASTLRHSMMPEPPSLPTTPDRFFPPGLAVVDSGNLSSKGSLSGETLTPTESDVEAAAADLSPVGSAGHFIRQCSKSSGKPFQVPPTPPRPPFGLGHGGVDIYSSPPPGLHPISAHTHVARPPPGLERATEALPSTGMPAPPPGLPPVSLFSAPVVPDVPAWAAAGDSELESEAFVFQPPPWDANMSLKSSETNGCEAFVNPVPGWSTCVVSDKLSPGDVSLKISDFAKHHVRENSPDRKRNLGFNGGLQSRNSEGCWQQLSRTPQMDNFNGMEQNDGCQLAGGSGAPMWNGCEGWLRDSNSSYDSSLSRPPNSHVTLCLAQQLSSAHNSDMYQEFNTHHSMGHPQEVYLADALQHHDCHHVDRQEFTEFMGDLTQSCGWSHPWNMQTSRRQDYSWAPALSSWETYGPVTHEFY